jgi:spore photoproduct lyase
MNLQNEIKQYVEEKYPRLGINKKREISRLLFEISRREKNSYKEIIENEEPLKFPKLKKSLVARRFPEVHQAGGKIEPYLPELNIDENYALKINETKNIYPENIYYEKSVSSGWMLEKVKKYFPESNYKEIKLLKDYIKENSFDIKTYNNRRNNLFIANENYDFFKKCPCTSGCVSCGYHILNIGFGCPYECTYCYLQEYSNSPGIILPANIDKYFEVFKKYTGKHIRIGTGEFTDSLALDHITGFSTQIIEFLRNYPEIVFEIKTKSNNIENIIKTEPAGNIVIAWSLNPQKFIEQNEFYSTTFAQRIEAAKKCIEAGYNVAFHFDPVVHYEGWDKEYKEVVDYIFDNISSKHVKWISIGTFRFPRSLKKVIENRFPQNTILNGELIIGFDGKLRYPPKTRTDIYKKMIEWIKSRTNDTFLYLCMEQKDIWEECNLSTQWRWK